MRFPFAFNALFLSLCCASAEKLEVDENIFNRGGNFGRRRGRPFSSASAFDCHSVGNTGETRCKLPSQNLRLEDGATIELSLEQKGRKFRCNHSPQGGHGTSAWTGECQGDARDAVFVKRKNQQGVEQVFGSVHVGSDACTIDPQGIRCQPQSNYEPEVEVDGHDTARALQAQAGRLLRRRNQQEAQSSEGGRSLQQQNSDRTIDILFLWTKTSECLNAGLITDAADVNSCVTTTDSTDLMLGMIDLAVEQTNIAFTASGVDATLRLVHAQLYEYYIEWTPSMSTLLGDVAFSQPVPPALRAQYGADMVHIILHADGACGVGYKPSALNKARSTWNPSNVATVDEVKSLMYSASKWTCATTYYTTAHEIGHNMGLNHDRGTVGNICNSAPTYYNYGYRDPEAQFTSIMAYGCNVANQCNLNQQRRCDRVLRYSNTNSLYENRTIGSTEENAARHLDEYADVIAGLVDFVIPFHTDAPSGSPSQAPFTPPSTNPSMVPSDRPSVAPVVVVPPSATPSLVPSSSPSAAPITPPSANPSLVPSGSPSAAPITPPSVKPSFAPSDSPSAAPVLPPTVPATCTDVNILIKTDRYPSETSWELVNDCSGEVVMSDDTYTSKLTEFNYNACLPDGFKYTFKVRDSYGDGVCCNYGSGKAVVELDGTEIYQADSFGSEGSKTFGASVCPGLPSTCTDVDVTILTDFYPSETSWDLLNDCTGEIIQSVVPNTYSNTLTEFNYNECVPDGFKYTFTVRDSYGDGICCNYGVGRGVVKFDGVEIYRAESFGAEGSTSFGVSLCPP